MPNNIEYAEVFQGFLDEELEHRSYTGWMAPDDSMIQYEGGKDVKIAQLDVSGLGDYKPVTDGSAYPNGSVSLKWVPYTFTMDRAVRFLMGRTDPTDSAFMLTSENVMRTFASKQLVPEQDMYRFNAIYAALKAKSELASHIKTLSAALTKDNCVAYAIPTPTAICSTSASIVPRSISTAKPGGLVSRPVPITSGLIWPCGCTACCNPLLHPHRSALSHRSREAIPPSATLRARSPRRWQTSTAGCCFTGW